MHSKLHVERSLSCAEHIRSCTLYQSQAVSCKRSGKRMSAKKEKDRRVEQLTRLTSINHTLSPNERAASPGPCHFATRPGTIRTFWQHFTTSLPRLPPLIPPHLFPETVFKMMFFAFGNLIYSTSIPLMSIPRCSSPDVHPVMFIP